jgi:hypothetical protein
MLFNEMLKELEVGKAVVRKSWRHEEGYLKLMLGMKSVWKILLQPTVNAGNYLFLMEDFAADDWEVIESYDVEAKPLADVA